MSKTICVEVNEYQGLKRVFDALYVYDKKPDNKNAKNLLGEFDKLEAYYRGGKRSTKTR